MLERELKLEVDGTFDVAAMPRSIGSWSVASTGHQQLEATYYDTADLRLLRAGLSLRFRDGWMVKVAQPADRPDVFQRVEVALPGLPDQIPREALDIVRSAARSDEPRPIARLSTERREFAVRDAGGSELARVMVDQVAAEVIGGASRSFHEVEIELAADAAVSIADPIVDYLREMGAGEVDRLPKLVRALGMSAAPNHEVIVEEAGPSSTAAEVVRAAISRSVLRFLDHAPLVILDEDPEGVHQARVATRRLRSDLRSFGRFLDRAWASQLRIDLRTVTALLGNVRDRDVLKSRLGELVGEVPAAADVLQVLSIERARAMQEMVDSFRRPAHAELLDRLVAAANRPPVSKRAERVAGSSLVRLAGRPWRKLRGRVEQLPVNPSPEELHRVRILTKRARYAIEAVGPVFGSAAEELAERLAELQDVLGEHQDAMVAAGWLRRLGPEYAATARKLGDFEVARAERAAGRWRAVWAAACREESINWMGADATGADERD